MKLIIGLGNPGQEYAQTRHNVGFMVVDQLGFDFKLSPKLKALIAKQNELLIAKPQDFMNNSGPVVRAVWDYYQLGDDFSRLIVIHDDLDMTLGSFKLQLGIGPKTHHGLNSLYQFLGTDQFWHARVGIDNRADHKFSGKDYVLEKFLPAELSIINEMMPNIITRLKENVDHVF